MQAPSPDAAFVTWGGVLAKVLSCFAVVPGKSIHFMPWMRGEGQLSSSPLACWYGGCVGWNVKGKQMVHPHTRIIFTWLYISSNPRDIVALVLIWLVPR